MSLSGKGEFRATQTHDKIVLVLEYDGTNYCGFQFQENAPTVQDEIEKALLKLTREKIRNSFGQPDGYRGPCQGAGGQFPDRLEVRNRKIYKRIKLLFAAGYSG